MLKTTAHFPTTSLTDADNDGIGDACDSDIDNDGIVDTAVRISSVQDGRHSTMVFPEGGDIVLTSRLDRDSHG